MINFWAERDQRSCFTIKSALAFFINLFKKKKYKVRKNNVKETKKNGKSVKVPSVLSVSLMDMRMSSSSPLSPALSTLTLTPGRTRDIDQDMEALRLSRQDNPFLQVLASRESLVESLFESESDDTNLMSQEFPNEFEVDPLSLPEIHEHMIRSPPPTTWPKSPNFKVFRFPDSEDSLQANNNQLGNSKKSTMKNLSSNSIKDPEIGILKDVRSSEFSENCIENVSSTHSTCSPRPKIESPHKRSNSECRESLSNIFPIFKPTPMRSLSDIRRLQSNGNPEDRTTDVVERRFDDEAPLTLPLLSKKFT